MVNSITFRDIHAPDCVLGENPIWHPSTAEFFWTDILNGVIYAYDPDFERNGKTAEKSVRTVLKTGFILGAFLAASGHGLALFTEQGVFRAVFAEDGYRIDAAPRWKVPFVQDERFNDAIADPAGQMISGSKREDNRDGRLYRFSVRRGPEVLLEGLGISNGMGFSPDKRTFYHTDTIPSTVTAYDYSPDGPLLNPRVVLRLDPDINPDGMTVDRDGNLWTACWGAGEILKLSPDGTVLAHIGVAAKHCSSLCFGGKDLGNLLVTSASIGGAALDGATFYATSAGHGKAETLADI
jgi:sugar lactone lactonase YvrE